MSYSHINVSHERRLTSTRCCLLTARYTQNGPTIAKEVFFFFFKGRNPHYFDIETSTIERQRGMIFEKKKKERKKTDKCCAEPGQKFKGHTNQNSPLQQTNNCVPGAILQV